MTPVNAQGAQYIDLSIPAEVASVKHKVEEHGKKEKYKAIQASISAPLAQIGAPGTGNASLTFVEYTDNKKNFHRIIQATNLHASSKVHAAFFNALSHAVTTYAKKVAAPAQDNPSLAGVAPEAIQINDADLKIGTPKKNKQGAIELVASSTLLSGSKITVTQNKQGVSEVVVSKEDKVKLEKAKKEQKNVHADAVINAIQQRCLAAIAAFKKANADKKIEKPVQKKEGKAPKAGKGHEHKAKHADGKKHHHGHKKHH